MFNLKWWFNHTWLLVGPIEEHYNLEFGLIRHDWRYSDVCKVIGHQLGNQEPNFSRLKQSPSLTSTVSPHVLNTASNPKPTQSGPISWRWKGIKCDFCPCLEYRPFWLIFMKEIPDTFVFLSWGLPCSDKSGARGTKKWICTTSEVQRKICLLNYGESCNWSSRHDIKFSVGLR